MNDINTLYYNISICTLLARDYLTAVTSEFKLNLEHRTFIIIAGPDINVIKLLILSFVLLEKA